jgi:hypothetical protein
MKQAPFNSHGKQVSQILLKKITAEECIKKWQMQTQNFGDPSNENENQELVQS